MKHNTTTLTLQKTPWRPKKITKNILQKLEQAFLLWFTDSEACIYANIKERTFYNYCKENEDFYRRKELLKHNLKMQAKTVIYEAITEKQDLQTAKWYLEKTSDEFNPQRRAMKQEKETITDVKINILSTEEQKQYEKILSMNEQLLT